MLTDDQDQYTWKVRPAKSQPVVARSVSVPACYEREAHLRTQSQKQCSSPLLEPAQRSSLLWSSEAPRRVLCFNSFRFLCFLVSFLLDLLEKNALDTFEGL